MKGKTVKSISETIREAVEFDVNGGPGWIFMPALEWGICEAFFQNLNESITFARDSEADACFLLLVAESLHRDRELTFDDVVKAAAADGIKIRVKAVKK